MVLIPMVTVFRISLRMAITVITAIITVITIAVITIAVITITAITIMVIITPVIITVMVQLQRITCRSIP